MPPPRRYSVRCDLPMSTIRPPQRSPILLYFAVGARSVNRPIAGLLRVLRWLCGSAEQRGLAGGRGGGVPVGPAVGRARPQFGERLHGVGAGDGVEENEIGRASWR